MHAHAQICIHTHAHKCTHAHAHRRADIRTHAHAHVLTQAHAHTCTHTHAGTHARTHTHTYTRARAHTRNTHARAHTRARTHTIAFLIASVPSLCGGDCRNVGQTASALELQSLLQLPRIFTHGQRCFFAQNQRRRRRRHRNFSETSSFTRSRQIPTALQTNVCCCRNIYMTRTLLGNNLPIQLKINFFTAESQCTNLFTSMCISISNVINKRGSAAITYYARIGAFPQ